MLPAALVRTQMRATGSAPGSAETGSGQPTVAPEHDSATTEAEDDPDTQDVEMADEPPMPEPANDNGIEELPATGTDG